MNNFKYLVLVSLILVACGGEDNEPVANEGEPVCRPRGIRNGLDLSVAEKEGEFPYVGYIITARNSLCTGTLINSRSVLTAAHCVTNSQLEEDAPNEVLFSLGTKISGEQNLKVVEVRVHEDYTGELLGGNDLAVLILEEEVSGVSPAKLLSEDFSFEASEAVDIVGYGQNEALAVGTKRLGIVTFEELFGNERLIRFASTPENSDQNACPGDSGGGAFVSRDGEVVLTGVAHAIDAGGNCNLATESIYTSINGNREWILSQLGEGSMETQTDSVAENALPFCEN